jgi:hypothetical protein
MVVYASLLVSEACCHMLYSANLKFHHLYPWITFMHHQFNIHAHGGKQTPLIAVKRPADPSGTHDTV